jgi:hypothetical protein
MVMDRLAGVWEACGMETGKLASLFAVQRVLFSLRGMANGTLPLRYGCRIVAGLRSELPSELGSSRAALAIAGIDSELDGFPPDDQRSLWSEALLSRLDGEKEEYLRQIREGLLEDCAELERGIYAVLGTGVGPRQNGHGPDGSEQDGGAGV